MVTPTPIPEAAARLAEYEAGLEKPGNAIAALYAAYPDAEDYGDAITSLRACLRALLADHASLIAERDRLAGALEPFRVACAAQMEHLQRMGLSPPDFETLGLHTFTVRDVRRAALAQPEHPPHAD